MKPAMDYIEQRDGGYWVRGTRVSLDSLATAFWRGQSPESIAGSFPALSLEQVYGAIACYLANRSVIDDYLRAEAAAFELDRANAATTHQQLRRRLEDARRSATPPH
jgi:uncharacterized protein (DUF433 family)